MAGYEVVNRSTGGVQNFWLHFEDGCWSATGSLPDGAYYTAVAETLAELKARIRESAAAEGWTGWALIRLAGDQP